MTDTMDTLDASPISPAENLEMAHRYLRAHILCAAGEPHVGDDQIAGSDHGHSLCWAVGAILAELAAERARCDEIAGFVREHRARIHRPTCMDGNGCRCGLADLPMWGEREERRGVRA